MRKTILYLLALAAVAAQGADFSGRYHLQNLREAGSELLLKPDGSFEFMLAYGAADYSAKGTWKAQREAVVLNSAAVKDAAPFHLLRSSAISEPMIRVRVVAPNGRAVPNIDVTLLADKPLEARTDSDGYADFPKDGAAKSVGFRIRVYQLETEQYKVNSAHNEFTFEINGEAITRVQFKDERLTVKGKTLVMRHWPDREMVYSK